MSYAGGSRLAIVDTTWCPASREVVTAQRPNCAPHATGSYTLCSLKQPWRGNWAPWSRSWPTPNSPVISSGPVSREAPPTSGSGGPTTVCELPGVCSYRHVHVPAGRKPGYSLHESAVLAPKLSFRASRSGEPRFYRGGVGRFLYHRQPSLSIRLRRTRLTGCDKNVVPGECSKNPRMVLASARN